MNGREAHQNRQSPDEIDTPQLPAGSLQPPAHRAGLSRRMFVGGSTVAAAAAMTQPLSAAADTGDERFRAGHPTDRADALDATDPGQLPQETSTFFATCSVEPAGSYAAPKSDGDLWPCCWADDDAVYAANGDGRGFSDEPFKDIVMNRITGTPETGLRGTKLAESEELAKVWGDEEKYNRKPTGMVCVNGVLYLAVQDLRYGPNAFDDAPNASISRSDDHGRTWKITDEPMFTDHRFTTVFFADFGKNSEHATDALGEQDGRYVYAYGMDWNWRLSGSGTVSDPVDLYLGRVPADHVQDRRRWQFFAGTDRRGRPRWSSKITDKAPVLHDPLRRYVDTQPEKFGNLSVISQGGVLYNAPLRRYIFSTWTDPSFEFYEAPNPWGPWRRFKYHNSGIVPWYQMSDTEHTPKNGGYGTVIPSKYVSADGLSMWLQTNWWTAPVPKPEDNYNFNLRKMKVAPFRRQRPSNGRDGGVNLARRGSGVTTIENCAFAAHAHYVNDGDTSRGETSEDGTNKNIDWWGYAWTRPYRINRLEYTTGKITKGEGGWFTRYGVDLRVQVRQNFRWVDVDDLRISPDYAYDSSVDSFATFTFRFADTWGDAVRLIGQPGGSKHYTSISELAVYYR